MNHKGWIAFSSIIVVALIIGTLAAFAKVDKVSAGSNGQQIYFYCPSYIQGVSTANRVIIKGTNQAGQPAQWEGWTYWTNNRWTSYTFARGWWWVGQVRVYWWQSGTNHWFSAVYQIPKVQNGEDVVYLRCGY